MSVIIRAAIVPLVLLATGCATIVKGRTQEVSIDSSVSGASFQIHNNRTQAVQLTGVTPAKVALDRGAGYFRGANYTVTVAKEGYEPAMFPLEPTPNAWYLIGNLGIGYLLGWFVVDPATGAMWDLQGSEIRASMAPLAPAASAASAPAPAQTPAPLPYAPEPSGEPVPPARMSAPAARPARTFLGLQVTQAERDYPDIDPSRGGRLFLTHRFPDSPLQVEFGYMDGGEAEIDTGDPAASATIDYRGFDALASLGLPLGHHSESRLWAGAGIYDGDTKVKFRVEDAGNVYFGSASESASGFQYGLGFDWSVSRKVAVRLDYRVLNEVSDFVDDRDLRVLGAGVMFSIGAESTAPRSRPAPQPVAPFVAPVPTPAPAAPAAPAVAPVVAAPSPPAAPSAPAAEPVVSAPTPAPVLALAPGGKARVVGGSLRTRPQVGADTRPVPADAILELKGSTRNAEGEWWYLGGPASGWAKASDLAPVP